MAERISGLEDKIDKMHRIFKENVNSRKIQSQNIQEIWDYKE